MFEIVNNKSLNILTKNILGKRIIFDRILFSPTSSFLPVHGPSLNLIETWKEETSNDSRDDIIPINDLALENLKHLITVLTGNLHPIVRKAKSFCAYRGCLNKIRMKKRSTGPSTKYIDKMMSYYKQKITKLQQTPGLEGKKKILQVTLYKSVSIFNLKS